MGTKGLFVALLATFLLLFAPPLPVTEAGLVQAPLPDLFEVGNCDGQPCLFSMLRPKRDDAADPAPADAPADGAAPAPADGAAAATPADGPAAAGAAAGGAAAAPAAGIGEIPLPPVTQQMPNLPPNFPYPDVQVVQEVPMPTKPRKKLIIGGGGVNPNPFPPIDPPMEAKTAPMEVPTAPMEPPSDEPEPPVAPIERESIPAVPSKPDCNVGGYGPPQDWRFPKARGHKKCPPTAPSTNSVMEVVHGNVVDDDDGSVNLRTVQRDDEAGAAQTTVHPHGKDSAVSTVCSMGALLVAIVASFLNFSILN